MIPASTSNKLPTLWELTKEQAAIVWLLERMDDPDEHAALTLEFQSLLDRELQKVDNVDFVFRMMDRMAEHAADESRRWSERKQAIEGRKRRLTEYVIRCMQQADLTQIEGAGVKFYLAQSPAAVEIVDEAAIPDEYRKVAPPPPDKIAIKRALQRGETVPGADLRIGGVMLQRRG